MGRRKLAALDGALIGLVVGAVGRTEMFRILYICASPHPGQPGMAGQHVTLVQRFTRVNVEHSDFGGSRSGLNPF
jgi:hypothetical protein